MFRECDVRVKYHYVRVYAVLIILRTYNNPVVDFSHLQKGKNKCKQYPWFTSNYQHFPTVTECATIKFRQFTIVLLIIFTNSKLLIRY